MKRFLAGLFFGALLAIPILLLDGNGTAPPQRSRQPQVRIEEAVTSMASAPSAAEAPKEEAPGVAPSGPSSSGNFIATVPWGKTATLTAMLLDVEGLAMKRRSLLVVVRYGDHDRRKYFTSDGAGRFEFLIEGALPEGRRGFLMVYPDVPSYRMQWYTPPVEVAYTELPAPLPVGRVDLGVLRLETQPLLVGGTIFDPEGRPIASASITISRWERGSELPIFSRTSTDEDGRFGAPMGLWEFDEAGNPLHPLDSITRGALEIEASRCGKLKAVSFSPGVEDMTIWMPRGGDVECIMLVPPSETVGWSATITDCEGQEHGPVGWVRSDGEVSFRLGSIPVGPASLRLRHESGRVVRKDFEVSADDAPAVVRVDLR